MKVLILGSSGQVGSFLKDLSEQEGDEVIAPDRSVLDLRDAGALERYVRENDADIVYNAAAYTAVDRAEEEPDLAAALNADAPAVIAAATAATGKVFIHLSTDYVFDGTSAGPGLREGDEARALNVYGRTKREGEVAVQAAGGAQAILRTSWVFSERGANFVKTMHALGKSREAVRVVADQTGSPTPALAIAEAMRHVALSLREDAGKSGLYHFAGSPPVSWADFARQIFTEAGMETKVIDIATEDFPTPAPRPAYTVLDTQLIMDVFGLDAPDWRAALPAVLCKL